MSMAGSTAMAGAQNVAGGISAIKAAMQKAQGAMDDGGMPIFQGSAGGDGNRPDSPLAEAMGDSGGSALQQAAKLAVGTTAELAKGAGAVIGEKAAKLGSDFMEKAQQTLGGQMAAAIRGQEDDQPNSIGPGSESGGSPEDEIAELVIRGHRDEKF